MKYMSNVVVTTVASRWRQSQQTGDAPRCSCRICQNTVATHLERRDTHQERRHTTRQTPPTAIWPFCAITDSLTPAYAASLHLVHTAAAANATTTPKDGNNALQFIILGCPLEAQYRWTNHPAYNARSAMLTVFAHTNAISPRPNNRDPPTAVTTSDTEAIAIMRLWACRSEGVHTDAKNASSMPLYAIVGR